MFVSTARQETLGLVALEAEAAGLPLVLRDIGVFRELFGSDGALVPSDADSFAAALKSLRHDPAARTKRRRECRGTCRRLRGRGGRQEGGGAVDEPRTGQREAGHCRVRNTARASARTSGASSAM